MLIYQIRETKWRKNGSSYLTIKQNMQRLLSPCCIKPLNHGFYSRVCWTFLFKRPLLFLRWLSLQLTIKPLGPVKWKELFSVLSGFQTQIKASTVIFAVIAIAHNFSSGYYLRSEDGRKKSIVRFSKLKEVH